MTMEAGLVDAARRAFDRAAMSLILGPPSLFLARFSVYPLSPDDASEGGIWAS